MKNNMINQLVYESMSVDPSIKKIMNNINKTRPKISKYKYIYSKGKKILIKLVGDSSVFHTNIY